MCFGAHAWGHIVASSQVLSTKENGPQQSHHAARESKLDRVYALPGVLIASSAGYADVLFALLARFAHYPLVAEVTAERCGIETQGGPGNFTRIDAMLHEFPIAMLHELMQSLVQIHIQGRGLASDSERYQESCFQELEVASDRFEAKFGSSATKS